MAGTRRPWGGMQWDDYAAAWVPSEEGWMFFLVEALRLSRGPGVSGVVSEVSNREMGLESWGFSVLVGFVSGSPGRRVEGCRVLRFGLERMGGA